MLVAQNSLGPVCPVPLTVRGIIASDDVQFFHAEEIREVAAVFTPLAAPTIGITLATFAGVSPAFAFVYCLLVKLDWVPVHVLAIGAKPLVCRWLICSLRCSRPQNEQHQLVLRLIETGILSA